MPALPRRGFWFLRLCGQLKHHSFYEERLLVIKCMGNAKPKSLWPCQLDGTLPSRQSLLIYQIYQGIIILVVERVIHSHAYVGSSCSFRRSHKAKNLWKKEQASKWSVAIGHGPNLRWHGDLNFHQLKKRSWMSIKPPTSQEQRIIYLDSVP